MFIQKPNLKEEMVRYTKKNMRDANRSVRAEQASVHQLDEHIQDGNFVKNYPEDPKVEILIIEIELTR